MYRLLIAALFLLLPSVAMATTCTGPNSVQIQSSGTSASYAVTDDGTGSGGCENKVNMDQIGGKAIVQDQCQANAHVITPFSVNSASTLTLVSGTSTKNTYVCYFFVDPVAAAVNFTLVSGTGTNCSTVHGTVGILGGLTAANGANLSANQGMSLGFGIAAIGATNTAGDNICIVPSGALQISGTIVTAVQ